MKHYSYDKVAVQIWESMGGDKFLKVGERGKILPCLRRWAHCSMVHNISIIATFFILIAKIFVDDTSIMLNHLILKLKCCSYTVYLILTQRGVELTPICLPHPPFHSH